MPPLSLKLYFHPLASFCHKALIALYEHDIPFEPVIVDLHDAASSAAFRAVWPHAKMPVLRDDTRDRTVAESTIIIEYLDAHYASGPRLIPLDADHGWQTRMWDRFYDHYIQQPMQKIVTDRLRPAGNDDRYGVAQAQEQLHEAYAVIDQEMGSKAWATGDAFTLADCAAAPALFYAHTVVPIAETRQHLLPYLDRLMARPSFARVLEEAQPYFSLFPMERKPRIARAHSLANR